MKYYIPVVLALFGAVDCFADSGGSLTYSFDKYPEITQILNQNNSETNCGSFVDVVSGSEDGVFEISETSDEKLYLVNYIDNCSPSWNYGSTLILKDDHGYRKADIRLPYQSNVEIEGVHYRLYKNRSEYSDGIYVVYYDIACEEGDDYLSIGTCESRKSYSVTMKYEFSGSEFQLISKNATLRDW
ncbi:hypothetical protein [Saccharospirillum salsuginis]|uniref:Uncharacterized protein n=1 Tax=Saccharospirillum salsuginis TaxID=418750 RepID=A0A918NFS6_9GAMM|nr:hypothetical protein [Saccharospirillum salsuginis]GGX63834.1 hypothetical protein GCM10007392_34340 [Saccharospirillum salsuginis]